MGIFSKPSTKISVIDPYAGTGIRELYQQLSQMFTPIGQGLTPYGGGEVVPGASPLQQAGFGAAGGLTPLAAGAQQYFGGALGMADPGAPQRYMGMAEQGLQRQMQPFDPTRITKAFEPVQRFAMQGFQDDFVPWAAEKYGPALGAQGSGAFGRELSRGAERLQLGLAAQMAPYQMQGYEAQMGRQAAVPQQYMGLAGLPGQVLGQAGQIGGMGTDMLSQQLGFGAQQRGITAEQQMWPYQQWQQPYSPQMMQLLQMALGQPGKEIVGQPQGAGMGYSIATGLAGGAGMGAGMWGMNQLFPPKPV